MAVTRWLSDSFYKAEWILKYKDFKKYELFCLEELLNKPQSFKNIYMQSMLLCSKITKGSYMEHQFLKFICWGMYCTKAIEIPLLSIGFELVSNRKLKKAFVINIKLYFPQRSMKQSGLLLLCWAFCT